MADEITLWNPRSGLLVPKNAGTVEAIAPYARQLTPRERDQVIAAFRDANFEMGSVFLWSRAMAGLKKQLATLGADFVAEMLDRTDIVSSVGITKVITDYEALNLAEQLGVFNGTEALRLRHAMELVAHFSDPPDDAETQEMMPEEALSVLRACVQGVLGHERLEGAVEFARFRHDLEARPFKADDVEIEQLVASPYFFRRTTLRVLLTLVKVAAGAQLENALANFELVLPLLWNDLTKPDWWLVGRTYAELHAAGKRTAAVVVRRVLMSVHGFDYVPEDLRSRTFITAAKKLQEIHFSMNNFYNEPEPMRALASLGTSIPMPAFPACMTAVLCVRLGNRYGRCWGAQQDASEMLTRLNPERWRYFLDECLPADDTILAKLCESPEIVKNWFDVTATIDPVTVQLRRADMRKVLDHSLKRESGPVQVIAQRLYDQIRQKTA
jgi:hypothetical protein